MSYVPAGLVPYDLKLPENRAIISSAVFSGRASFSSKVFPMLIILYSMCQSTSTSNGWQSISPTRKDMGAHLVISPRKPL